MFKRYKGSSVIQYAIIIALVALALIPAFFLVGKNIVDFFTSFHEGLAGSNNNTSSPNVAINPGDLSGSAENPIKNCANGVCTIDYGDFVLNGISENFNDLVQSSGVSGGTDLIASLIEQLANQLENENKTKEAEQIMALANLGHNLALLQNYAETVVKDCNRDSVCMENEFNLIVNKPAGYDESIALFPSNVTYNELSESIFDLGRAKNYQTQNPEEYAANIANNRLAYLLVEQYDTVINNPGISDSVKGVLQELFWSIGTVAEDFDNNLGFLVSSSTAEFFDPITGAVSYATPGSDPFSEFENYTASKITHFDSSLICGASNNIDSGTSCH